MAFTTASWTATGKQCSGALGVGEIAVPFREINRPQNRAGFGVFCYPCVLSPGTAKWWVPGVEDSDVGPRDHI